VIEGGVTVVVVEVEERTLLECEPDPDCLTVRSAALLVAVPPLLLTVAVNSAPLYEVVVAEILKVDDVAPPITIPFSYH
jgi:hypothetical protein